MKTLIELLKSFESRNNKVALVYRTGFRRSQYSYGEIYYLSLKMATWLGQGGIKKNDKVVIWAPNSPWWIVAFFGSIANGSIVVPVDFTSQSKRTLQVSKLVKAKLIIQSRYTFDKITGKNTIYIEDLEYEISKTKPKTRLSNTKADDIAEIIYTSGSTGDPKGVVLTHKNILSNVEQALDKIQITPDYKLLSLLPLSHMFEQTVGLLIPLNCGATIVYLRILKPSSMIEAFKEENIYSTVVVPRLLFALKNSIERQINQHGFQGFFKKLLQLANILNKELKVSLFFYIHKNFGHKFKFFVCGGSALDPALVKFWGDIGFTIIEGYGLTECSPILTANSLKKQIVGSVGEPLKGVSIEIQDGEVIAKGDNIFREYWENPKATKESFTKEGWFKTGDQGEIKDNNLYIKGRKKELIVTGSGINVYPEDIERVLNSIKGVVESCVFGLDRGQGEDVHAVLVLEDKSKTPEQIIQLANQQIDIPQRVTGFSVWHEFELPKTTTLKIQRYKVKQELEKIHDKKDSVAFDRLTYLIAKVTSQPYSKIHEKSVLNADLSLTSIGRLELINYLEQDFHLDLEDTIITQYTTVGDLRSLITKRERHKPQDKFKYWTNTWLGRFAREFIDLILHYPILLSFTSLRIKGKENLELLKEPVIFACNHLSYLDQPAVMRAIPRQIRYKTATAMREEFFFEEKGNFLRKLRKRLSFEYSTVFGNLFPIPQKSGFRRALVYMGWLMDQGVNIFIFPEGERSKDGKLLPFYPGIGLMVKELNAPVVPIKVQGMEDIFPRGAALPRKGVCNVTFGKPIYFSKESPSEIVNIIRNEIERL